MNTNRLETLGARTSNRTIRAAVTRHARDFLAGATVCGISFETLNAQEFNIHQTTICGSNSDVNCTGCIEGGALQIVDAGKPCGHSRRSSSKLHHVKRGGKVVGTITTLFSDIVILKLDGEEKTFDCYMGAYNAVFVAPGGGIRCR